LEFAEAMNDIGRKALWVIRELRLPAIVKTCVSCRSTRHYPTGKFRVNANGKLLDIWMLIRCEMCDRTSKIPVHERIYVQALERERLLKFQNNDPAMVRDLVMDGALAGKAAYQLDWSGTWELKTEMPPRELEREAPVPLEVIIRFELPVPIRVDKLLTAGLGLSRSAVRSMVDSGHIRLPMAINAKAREDFTFSVIPMALSPHEDRVPAPSAIDSSRAPGSVSEMGSSARDVREVIAIALRVASSANPAQAASAGLNPAVTLAGVPRCPLAANTAVEMAIAKTPPRRCAM
jgi:hypothetical protein